MSKTTPQVPVSAFIICMNEASQIGRCLESVSWCQEIVVVDSGSTDATLEICRQYTDKILVRKWTGYVEQKRFALEQCSCPWVLNIDADEQVSKELKEEIISVINNDVSSRILEDGFYISRVVYYMNRWWRNGGWYPEYRLRLCRKAKTTWGGTDPHEKAIVHGNTRKLVGELYHYTYHDLYDQITRLNKFSSSAADSLLTKKYTTTVFELLIRPIFRFIKFYFFRFGYRDGIAGLIVALLEAYYVFLKYAKVWENQNQPACFDTAHSVDSRIDESVSK